MLCVVASSLPTIFFSIEKVCLETCAVVVSDHHGKAPHTASTPAPKKLCITNWELCVLCQEKLKSALVCPARFTKSPIDSGYKLLARHLVFQTHGHMPIDIDINRLDDGDGWH